MNTQKPATRQEIDERLSSLISNASAIRAITGAVEGTLGPLGLDTMLVDRSGDIIITNAGVTILDRMEVSHPAARMLISIARAQHDEVGDGTTTATIMAGTMISEGLSHILKGVPVSRVIDGIKKGVTKAIEVFKKLAVPVQFPDDPSIRQTALIAGRGIEDIAEKAALAAKISGYEKLMDPSFKLKDIVVAVEGADNEVFEGIIIKKKPVNDAMPVMVEKASILCMDDSLEPEKPEDGSLHTELGLQRHYQKQKEFEEHLGEIVMSGVKAIFLSRGLSEKAEQMLTEMGVLVVSRLTLRQMKRLCEHTGAIAVKRSALEKKPDELEKFLGCAEKIYSDRKLKNVRILGGGGKPAATLLVGAPTPEVAEEKERIACDAVSAVQAAVRAGVVSGGGSTELAVSQKLFEFRSSIKGMSSYGVDCVIESLKRPLAQIIQNAGFNPLEKVEEVISAQLNSKNYCLGIDCDTGEVTDMRTIGVIDPALVKLHALKAAGEVAQAILRINTIIKMKDEKDSGIPQDYMGF
ncbi:MAG: TCP-1/cpn60 chaperonin family protein [Firmicutes bacterium]|nr:TCP-1/cpn60 chaperonin family protein [Bacillota bacterium]